MKLSLDIGFEELLNLINQLSQKEKKKLINKLYKTLQESDDQNKAERQLGEYEGEIWMAEDFNAPLDDFKDYV